jgi:dUTP pyrophosphatase
MKDQNQLPPEKAPELADVFEPATAFGKEATSVPNPPKRGVGRPRKNPREGQPLVLKVFLTHREAKVPKFSTEGSACFDIAFCPYGKTEYSGFLDRNSKFTRNFHHTGGLYVNVGERVMVPTGLIFEIPEGYSVRIHPRSGLSLKNGINLVNQEAVIDSDFFHETMMLVQNNSVVGHMIMPGDRIAQGELVKTEMYTVAETVTEPSQTTQRAGGLGSTGVGNE